MERWRSRAALIRATERSQWICIMNGSARSAPIDAENGKRNAFQFIIAQRFLSKGLTMLATGERDYARISLRSVAIEYPPLQIMRIEKNEVEHRQGLATHSWPFSRTNTYAERLGGRAAGERQIHLRF